MINFSIPPLGGEQVLPLLGAEQTTSSLVVMIMAASQIRMILLDSFFHMGEQIMLWSDACFFLEPAGKIVYT